MRISDLSRQTGVPIATIKYYLRERLLPPGTPTGRNQAEYDESHVRRLRLIRAFANVGHLDLSTVRELLTAIENEPLPLPGLFAVVDHAVSPAEAEPNPADTLTTARARDDVNDFVDQLGWRVGPDAPGRARLADVVATLRLLGCDCKMEYFTPFAEAAERLANQELDLLPPDGVGADRAAAVVRTILLEIAFSATRRMAQEHVITERYGQPAHSAGRSSQAS